MIVKANGLGGSEQEAHSFSTEIKTAVNSEAIECKRYAVAHTFGSIENFFLSFPGFFVIWREFQRGGGGVALCSRQLNEKQKKWEKKQKLHTPGW